MLPHNNTQTERVQAERQQTTLAIDTELWKRTKIQAIHEGRDARDLVESALALYLESVEKSKAQVVA